MAALTAADFDEAKRIAKEFLWDGNALIATAIRNPVNKYGDIDLQIVANLASYRQTLLACGDKIEKVQPYLKRVVDKPVEHVGLIATTAHSLAYSFAQGLCLGAFLAVQNQVLSEQTARGEALALPDGKYCWQQETLDRYWEPVRDAIRTSTPIAAYRLGQVIELEATRAEALIEAPEYNPDEMISAPAIAERYGVNSDRLRSRLSEFRKKHKFDGDSWTEIENTRRNAPKYLYRLGSVWHIVEGLRRKTSAGSSSKK